MKMTAEEEKDEIVRLAIDCRIAQRKYFRDRGQDDLQVAKAAETVLDRMIVAHQLNEKMRRGI